MIDTDWEENAMIEKILDHIGENDHEYALRERVRDFLRTFDVYDLKTTKCQQT
jgi:hypothetical protein